MAKWKLNFANVLWKLWRPFELAAATGSLRTRISMSGFRARNSMGPVFRNFRGSWHCSSQRAALTEVQLRWWSAVIQLVRAYENSHKE